MSSLDASVSLPAHTSARALHRGHRVQGPALGKLRAPWRKGPWSSQEVALALHARRDELRREFARRSDARGVAPALHGEIVDEAICAVVMGREVVSEDHLIGAFWTAVRLVVRHHHEGRGRVRVGTRLRVDFEAVSEGLSSGPQPEEIAELRDRMARAADYIASLDELEQQVVVAMAVHGDGFKRAARRLGLPIGAVRAAIRSGEAKLEQVAAIAAAGRMCGYREPAIHAHAAGIAHEDQLRVARAHIAACHTCHRSYVRLAREMRGTTFKSQAAAACLPAPLLGATARQSPFGRLFSILGGHPVSGASAERTAGVLGGGGLVKAAAATSALVIASAGVGVRVVRSLEAPTPIHHRHIVRPTRTVEPGVPVAAAPGLGPRLPGDPTDAAPRREARAVSRPPSRSLGYLALGGSTGGSRSVSRASVATAASTSSTGRTDEAPVPSRSGGGASLNYLGH